jgi:hypothetical protein
MGELREMFNNNKMRLGFYSRSLYNKNVSSSSFTEFTFDNKPLLNSYSEISTTVYSVLNDGSFDKQVTVQLENKLVENIVGIGDISQTSFFSNYMKQGINLKKDYIFRLYENDGFEDYEFFTGVVIDIVQKKSSVQFTLASRLSELKYSDGIETRTALAGWLENAQFNASLQALLSGSDVQYEGDVNEIDYASSTNETTVDLRVFTNSAGVFSYDDNEVVISNISSADSSKYGTKYNFIANTIENFGLDDVLHFSFKRNNGDTYFVVEKRADRNKSLGQYAKLYLVNENTPTSYTYLGVGRTNETVVLNILNEDVEESIQGAYVKDTRVDALSEVVLDYHPTTNMYHYYNQFDGGSESFTGFLGQVIEYNDYYVPVFGYATSIGFVQSRNTEIPNLTTSTLTFSGNNVIGADTNSINYDILYDDGEFDTPVGRLKMNESIKSRAYFLYDDVNDRLIFQRASDSAPNTNSYNIGLDLEKSWDNFGLNPIGFYDFNELGYISKANDLFINDWVFADGNIYASTLLPYNTDYTVDDSSKGYKITKIDSSGSFSTIVSLPIHSGFYGYGLHYYDNKISFVGQDGVNWIYYSEIINGVPTLINFKNQVLQYVDIETPANNIEYPSTTLDKNKLGGYIVKSTTTEDFTAKFEDHVITALAQVRGDLLDMTSLNRLQGLLMLCNMANKFIYVDERDILIIKNKGSVLSSSTSVTDILDVEITDAVQYKTVDVSSYFVDDTEIFKWNLNAGEYIQDILGVWNGLDASFSMNITILTATTFKYTIVSDGTLATSETIHNIDDPGNDSSGWNNIIIDKGDDFIKISFLVINSTTEEIPEPQSKFTLFFNSKELKKTNISTTATDETTDSIKTKKINNRFVGQDNAVLLREDIKDYFLGEKKLYMLSLLDPLIRFNPLQVVQFRYDYEQIYIVNCFVKRYKIKQNGTTQIELQEV